MRYKTKTISILCGLMLATLSGIKAQETRVHNMYVEFAGPGMAYSVNYDTRFKPTHNGFGMRVGLGFWTYSENRLHRIVLPIQLNYLIGKRRHLMEIGAGTTLLHSGGGGSVWDVYDEKGFVAVATLSAGYRFQPVTKGVNARAGATLLVSTKGLPGFVPGIGVGYTFSK